MYYSITGKVVFFEEGRLVIETNGIGYDVLVSNITLDKFGVLDKIVTVFTTVRVTDDTIKIYGFHSKEEKGMFTKLVSVSSVGPKTALVILSTLDPKELALNIVNSDYKALSKVKGIGKKTAMRIIMELKEKLEEEDIDMLNDDVSPIHKAAKLDQVAQDAALALCSLGMTKGEATKAVSDIRSQGNTVEELITLVLRGIK